MKSNSSSSETKCAFCPDTTCVRLVSRGESGLQAGPTSPGPYRWDIATGRACSERGSPSSTSGAPPQSFLPLNHNSPSLFKSFLDGLLDFLRMQEEDLVLGLQLEKQEKKARGEEK